MARGAPYAIRNMTRFCWAALGGCGINRIEFTQVRTGSSAASFTSPQADALSDHGYGAPASVLPCAAEIVHEMITINSEADS